MDCNFDRAFIHMQFDSHIAILRQLIAPCQEGLEAFELQLFALVDALVTHAIDRAVEGLQCPLAHKESVGRCVVSGITCVLERKSRYTATTLLCLGGVSFVCEEVLERGEQETSE